MNPIKTEFLTDADIAPSHYEKEIFDLRQLLEISKGLNSTLDYNLLLDSILFTCMGQMRVLNACVFTRRYLSRGEFSLHRNYKGFEVDHSIEYMLPEDSPILRLLSESFRCYTLDELLCIGIREEELFIFRILNPEILIPLTSKEMLHGIILLGNRIEGEGFTEKEREYLLHIAVYAAIAIHNAFLFEMTTTDMMTKLKTRHFFETTLHSMLHSDSDEYRPLSLVLFDIDFFKRINDNYGHLYGDMVIKEVTSIIRRNVRQNDIAARYGGEEFGVILPGTSIETAKEIADRIRVAVSHLAIDYQGKPIRVSISAGVAECRAYCESHINAFIDKADTALYLSKNAGRNKTTVSD